MTTAETTIKTVTEATAEKLNSFLHHWNATLEEGQTGHFVRLTKKEDSDGQNRLLFLDVLDDDDDTTDMSRYCWHYWNTNRYRWNVSDLSADASFNEVVDFLVRHLDAE